MEGGDACQRITFCFNAVLFLFSAGVRSEGDLMVPQEPSHLAGQTRAGVDGSVTSGHQIALGHFRFGPVSYTHSLCSLCLAVSCFVL